MRKARPETPAQRKGRIDWSKVIVSALFGCAVFVAGLGWLYKAEQHRLLQTERSALTGSRSRLPLREASPTRVTDQPDNVFRYPFEDDIGAPIPSDPNVSSYPALPDDQRRKLNDFAFSEDAEIPPEFNIE